MLLFFSLFIFLPNDICVSILWLPQLTMNGFWLFLELKIYSQRVEYVTIESKMAPKCEQIFKQLKFKLLDQKFKNN